MKPDYPFVIPALGTYTTSDYPKAEYVNIPNRELEAICVELGLNPKVIRDGVPPEESPENVAAYLGMIGNIVKNLVGVRNWYLAAVPARHSFGGHGNGATIAAAATNYAAIYGRALNAAETVSTIPIPYPGKVTKINAQILTAQPGTGSLVWTLRKNGVDQALSITFAAGAAANSIGLSSGSISYAAGDTISMKIVNNAPAAVSAQIGAFNIEFDQAG